MIEIMTVALFGACLFVLVLLVAVLKALSALQARAAAFPRIESKLDRLLDHAGLVPAPDAVPPGVADALRQGEKIQAIKLYREATGAGLKDAKDAVEAVQTHMGLAP